MATSFEQNIRFQPKQEERLDEFNFDGGLVTDTHETKLELSQSPDVRNVTYNDNRSVKTRNGYARYNGDPVGASSHVSNSGSSTGTVSIATPNDFAAQIVEPTDDIDTLQVDLSLAMETDGEEQRVRVEIRSVSGGEPSQLLARSQVKTVSGDSEATYSFRFREPLALSDATPYAIVLRPFVQGTAQVVNEVLVHRTGDDYADGTVFTSSNGGVSWTEDTDIDLKFAIYDGGNTGSTGLLRFYGQSGIQQLIAKFGESVYWGDDATGALAEAELGGDPFNASNDIDWTVVEGTLLVVDGDGFIRKYRGSTNANYDAGTISVTNGSSTVSGSGTSWGTPTNAEPGEYILLPDGKWYRITAIASDTSLTIEVEYQGSTESGEEYVISPWGEVQGDLNRDTAPSGLVRPRPKFIENHINRVWTLEGNTLRFSVLDTSIAGEHFNDWDTGNNAGTIIIPAGRGDTGTGLYSLGNALFVFQRRSIWALYGNSPANFELRNVTKEVGMIDKKTLVEWSDVLLFLSDDGIQMFDGSNVRNISDGVVNKLIKSWANKTSAVATLWDSKYIIAYTRSGEVYNSEALFYDLTRNIWGKMTGIHASAWSNWAGGNDRGEVYFASSNQGTVHRWDTGGNDDGYEIHTLYDTASLGFGGNVNDKTVKKVYLQQLAKGDYDMTATMFADISAAETASSINLSGGSTSLWDVMQWDVDPWSSEGDIITTRIAEFQGLAKFFRFRFEQTGLDEGIEILGATITARVRRLT